MLDILVHNWVQGYLDKKNEEYFEQQMRKLEPEIAKFVEAIAEDELRRPHPENKKVYANVTLRIPYHVTTDTGTWHLSTIALDKVRRGSRPVNEQTDAPGFISRFKRLFGQEETVWTFSVELPPIRRAAKDTGLLTGPVAPKVEDRISKYSSIPLESPKLTRRNRPHLLPKSSQFANLDPKTRLEVFSITDEVFRARTGFKGLLDPKKPEHRDLITEWTRVSRQVLGALENPGGLAVNRPTVPRVRQSRKLASLDASTRLRIFKDTDRAFYERTGFKGQLNPKNPAHRNLIKVWQHSNEEVLQRHDWAGGSSASRPYRPGVNARKFRELDPFKRSQVISDTDSVFHRVTGFKGQIDPKNPAHRPLTRTWLRLRDELMDDHQPYIPGVRSQLFRRLDPIKRSQAINETDRLFRKKTGFSGQIDLKNPQHRDLTRIWLRTRDDVIGRLG
jgi:hypothetical protein